MSQSRLSRRTWQRGYLRWMDYAVAGGILAVLLLVVIPSMLRSRVLEAHDKVIDDMATMSRMQQDFFLTHTRSRYARLEELFARENVPDTMSVGERHSFLQGQRHGYVYSVRALQRDGNEPGFELHAVPAKYGRTGVLTFYLDESKVLRAGDLNGLQGDLTLPELTIE